MSEASQTDVYIPVNPTDKFLEHPKHRPNIGTILKKNQKLSNILYIHSHTHAEYINLSTHSNKLIDHKSTNTHTHANKNIHTTI